MSAATTLPATPIDLPLLPLRDVVVFPHMVIPLFVGRPKSIKALEAAMAADRRIMLVAQKAAAKDEPSVADMFEGSLGEPPGGWPKKLAKVILKGGSPKRGRPGALLEPANLGLAEAQIFLADLDDLDRATGPRGNDPVGGELASGTGPHACAIPFAADGEDAECRSGWRRRV